VDQSDGSHSLSLFSETVSETIRGARINEKQCENTIYNLDRDETSSYSKLDFYSQLKYESIVNMGDYGPVDGEFGEYGNTRCVQTSEHLKVPMLLHLIY
jgi:hypothetical protein